MSSPSFQFSPHESPSCRLFLILSVTSRLLNFNRFSFYSSTRRQWWWWQWRRQPWWHFVNAAQLVENWHWVFHVRFSNGPVFCFCKPCLDIEFKIQISISNSTTISIPSTHLTLHPSMAFISSYTLYTHLSSDATWTYWEGGSEEALRVRWLIMVVVVVNIVMIRMIPARFRIIDEDDADYLYDDSRWACPAESCQEKRRWQGGNQSGQVL